MTNFFSNETQDSEFIQNLKETLSRSGFKEGLISCIAETVRHDKALEKTKVIFSEEEKEDYIFIIEDIYTLKFFKENKTLLVQVLNPAKSL